MRLIFVLAPYIIVPLLIAFFFRRSTRKLLALTFVITFVIILLYPLGLFWIDDYLNPPLPGPQCYTPQMAFIMGNLFLFLPAALVFQFVFNRAFAAKNVSENKNVMN